MRFRHFLPFALCVGLIVGAVYLRAQLWTPVAVGTHSAAAGYIGPGNVVSGFAHWYGLRGYNAAYATGSNAAIQVEIEPASTTQDLVILTDGTLDVATAATFGGIRGVCTGTISGTALTVSSCASGAPYYNAQITGAGINQPAFLIDSGCFSPPGVCTINEAQTVSTPETITFHSALWVTNLYDQVGSVTLTQASGNIFYHPILMLNCLGTLPCMISGRGGDGTAGQMLSGTFTSPAQPYSFTVVAERRHDLSSYGMVIGAGVSGLYFSSSSNTAAVAAGTVVSLGSVADNALHAMQAVVNSPTCSIYVDGTDSGSADCGTGAGDTTLNIFDNSNAATLNGIITEAGIKASTFSSGDKSALCHNQYLYWGTAASC